MRRLSGFMYIDDCPASLLIVEGIMLDVGHESMRLYALDDVTDDNAREQGVFTGLFKEMTIAWIASKIDAPADRWLQPCA